MDIALWDTAITITIRSEALIGININAVECVDEVFYRLKAYFYSVRNLDATKEVRHCVLAHVDAINTSVSELVFRACSAMELDVKITRNRYEEDFILFRIDYGEHINVATGRGSDASSRVCPADIDNERIVLRIDLRNILFFLFELDIVGKDNLELLVVFLRVVLKDFEII